MDLGPWVLAHQVCWELRPRSERQAQGVVRAGFELELFARGPTLADDPGSAEWRAAYERLVAVARLALLPELQPVAYAPFDRAFHLVGGNELLPEIQLHVDIGPLRGPTNSEVERAMVLRLEARLRSLGARPRSEPSRERRPPRSASRPAGIGRRDDPPDESLAGRPEKWRNAA